MKMDPVYTVDGIHIKDKWGRVVLLRGCNLGGDSKIPFSPAGNPLSYDVSFTGRPFPESEADAHFARLAGWGFTFLRLVITWEAVEHAGPGIYDEDYLAYLRSILKTAEAHGITVFVDPHQDVWSRWTGGDGAPGWTLEAVGFDLARIAETGAAFTEASEGPAYIPMSWGMNYLRYANATMWTLFFGGNVFAPGKLIEGVPVQDWLQDHFIDAMKHVARRLKDCAAVAGFGTLNEPHRGFIGLRDLDSHTPIISHQGAVPTALESMAAASGMPQVVKAVSLAGMISRRRAAPLNPSGARLFREGFDCPWREAGVWGMEDGRPVARKHDWFFRKPDGGEWRFADDFLKPFQQRFMAALAQKHPQYVFFIEGLPMGERPSWSPEERQRADGSSYAMVEAFHWYDGVTLLLKRWLPWLNIDSESRSLALGPGAMLRGARRQLARLAAKPRGEGMPALVGEFGISYDMKGGASYRTGDYADQEAALGSFYDALDAALLPSTIWNYTASNTHQMGDGWNTEDLSVYSASTGEGRAVRGFCRPYAMAVSGVPVEMRFDRKKRVFTLVWDAAGATGGAEGAEPDVGELATTTEIFVPSIWYPEGWRAEFAGEGAELEEKPDAQRLLARVSRPGRVRVTVRPLAKDER